MPKAFDPEAWLQKAIEVADRQRPRGQINLTSAGIEFGDFEGVQRYAKLLVSCGCVPTTKEDTYDSQLARATMCILLGRRVGLAPEQAVTSIYVVNSRPVIFGDAPLAICRQHPKWIEEHFREYWLVDGKPYSVPGPDGKPRLIAPPPKAFENDSTIAVCETGRQGGAEIVVRSFSIGDAKKAGLFGRNANLYGGYPQRMLMFRARGYCLRDNFGDALKGIGIKELTTMEETERDPEPERESALPEGVLELRDKPVASVADTNGKHEAVAAAVPAPAAENASPAESPKNEPVEPKKKGRKPAREHLGALEFMRKEKNISDNALLQAMVELGIAGESATQLEPLDTLSEDQCKRIVDHLATAATAEMANWK